MKNLSCRSKWRLNEEKARRYLLTIAEALADGFGWNVGLSMLVQEKDKSMITPQQGYYVDISDNFGSWRLEHVSVPPKGNKWYNHDLVDNIFVGTLIIEGVKHEVIVVPENWDMPAEAWYSLKTYIMGELPHPLWGRKGDMSFIPDGYEPPPMNYKP